MEAAPIIREEIKKIAKGKSVLDVGGYDGEHARTGIQSGAIAGICIDDDSWAVYGDWGKPQHYPEVKYIKGNFMYYQEPADIVVLANTIYHQRNPWMSLEKIRKLTKEVLFLSTSLAKGEEPVWKVYRPYEGHPVSWTVAWRPTVNGLITLLEATGFKNTQILGQDEGDIVVKTYPNEALPIGFGERT